MFHHSHTLFMVRNLLFALIVGSLKILPAKGGIFKLERNAKNPRILEVKNGGAAKLLEHVVKEVNPAMENTIEAVVKARSVAVNKVLVTYQVVELSNTELEKCDDDELAFRLHRQ
ncbi:hypothetical protein V6N13_119919 [Hibiscus sabdariffa]